MSLMQTNCFGQRFASWQLRHPTASNAQHVPPMAQRHSRVLRQRPPGRTNVFGDSFRRAERCHACRRDGKDSEVAEATAAGLHSSTVTFIAGVFFFALTWPSMSQAAVQNVHQSEVFQLASGDSDFWVNVSRYGRYFITVLSGTAYIGVKPILGLLKRPKTAVAVVLAAVALYFFVSTTVQAMLGVSNPLEYQPSGFFPENY